MNRTSIAAILISLIAGIGGGYVISYEEISGLKSEIRSLESEVSTLTTEYDNLNTTYNQLKDDYSNLNSTYNSLSSTYYELQTAYEEANATIAELEQMVNYEVYVLTDEEYYQSIINDLKTARETILVAMYSMIYDPDDSFDWANDLIRELVYADERGINVSVVIEYRTYWDYMDQNLEAYNYLLAHNVTVQPNTETSTDHMKIVVVDDKLVYVGSHNWSESALYYNHETSVKIVSEVIAEMFKEYLETTFGI